MSKKAKIQQLRALASNYETKAQRQAWARYWAAWLTEDLRTFINTTDGAVMDAILNKYKHLKP